MDRRQLLSLGQRFIEPAKNRVEGHHAADSPQLANPELHLGGNERKSPPGSQLPGLRDQREETCDHLTPCGKIAFNMETSDVSAIQVQITLESSQITQYLATLGISLY